MMLIYYKTWIYQCLIKQVKSPSTWSRVPNSVRIRHSGRVGNRGVTSYANEVEMKGFNAKMKKRKSKRGRPNKVLYKMRIRPNLV